MIWFDIKELERGLKSGDLSDKYIFNYLLANLILFSVMPYLSSDDYTTKWMLVLDLVIVVIVTIVGTKKTFDINSAGDNRDFFKRFLSLSFVTCIRLVVMACIAAIPLGTIVYLVEKNVSVNEILKDVFWVALTALVGIVYYFMLTASFKRVSQ